MIFKLSIYGMLGNRHKQRLFTVSWFKYDRVDPVLLRCRTLWGGLAEVAIVLRVSIEENVLFYL